MFRHQNNPVETGDKPPTQTESVSGKESLTPPQHPENLKELIEKNLKWSQIIYEQNRKINSKLLWYAAASWIRTFLILIPLILAGIFLPPFIKDAWDRYADIFNISNDKGQGIQQSDSLDNLFKLFNIDPAKQEQIKAMLK